MKSVNLPKSFDQLITGADKPVLVDFWAAWCGPCRMVSPVIEQIAREFKGQLITIKVNVDKKPHVAAKFEIQSIPTIMLFKKGQPVMRQAGAMPYETLKAQILPHL